MNKVNIVITTLDEFGEETEMLIRPCKDVAEAEQFVLEHEQDFADDPEIYAVYIESLNRGFKWKI